MKYKSVVFDLDGTLLDTSIGIRDALLYTLNKMGFKDVDGIDIESFIGPPIQNSLIDHFGYSKTAAQNAAEIFRNYYKANSLLKASPYNDIYDLIRILSGAGIKLGVATYKREDYAIELLNAFHFSDYCNVIHGADNNNSLTKSEIILACVDELKEPAKDTLYLGDTLSDYNSASACGIDFVGVTYGFGLKPNIKYVFPTIMNPIQLLDILDMGNDIL